MGRVGMIFFGMAALGLLVGVFAAWSATPIVTTLLPLLFGVVGGASGFSVARMDVSTKQGKYKLNLIGSMLGSFSIACLIAVLVAVYYNPTMRQTDEATLPPGATATDYVDAIILKRMLQVLGADPRETAHLFELLGAGSNKGTLSETVKKIDETLKRLPVLATGSSPSQEQQRVEYKKEWGFPLAYQSPDWSSGNLLIWDYDPKKDLLLAPKGG